MNWSLHKYLELNNYFGSIKMLPRWLFFLNLWMLFKSITYSRWIWTSPPKTWELILLTDDNTNICCLFPENVVYIKSACFLNINFMNHYSLSLDISFTILSPLGSQRFNTFTHHHDQWVISHYSNNSFSSRRVIRK